MRVVYPANHRGKNMNRWKKIHKFLSKFLEYLIQIESLLFTQKKMLVLKQLR